MKVICSWSGGKDGCLACYEAKGQGHEICYLLNFREEDGKKSISHGLDAELISMQSHLAGVPLITRNANRVTYEAQFKDALREARRLGVEGGIFGDIDLQPHRDWLERACAEVGIEPLFPLWKRERMDLMNEFLDAGFEAVVVSTLGRVLGQDWLGRNINEQFIKDILALQQAIEVDLCGEAGEYHTFVTGGPLFSQRIKITLAQPVLRDEYWYADVMGYTVE